MAEIKFLSLWFGLSLLRICLVILPQTGYIHPDEFFQSVEVTAGDILNVEASKPWEFNSTSPIRSSSFMMLTTGLPLYLLKALDHYFQEHYSTSVLTSYSVLVAPRLFLALLSFFNDFCLWNLCRKFGVSVQRALVLNAFSYVALVYQTRTFSNTIETLLFSFLLVLSTTTVAMSNKGNNSANAADSFNKGKNSSKAGHACEALQMKIPDIWSDVIMSGMFMGGVVVCGVFNRPTFVLFALVPLLFWLLSNLSVVVLVGRIVYFIIGAFMTTTCLILLDTVYYKQDIMHLQTDIQECLLGNNSLVGCLLSAAHEHLIFTPWNFVTYNTNPENLASHGTHPKFLHFLVNIPMLFGPLAAVALMRTLSNIFGNPKRFLDWRENCMGLFSLMFYVPIALLSIFPHQEPRFLIPTLLPLILISSSSPKSRPCLARVVSLSWVLFNVFGTVFFGFVHQAGVVPCLTSLQTEIRTDFLNSDYFSEASMIKQVGRMHIVFFHTYSPPQHLLLLGNHGARKGNSVVVHNLGGADDNTLKSLLQTLKNDPRNQNTNNRSSELFVVMPFSRIFRNCGTYGLSWHGSFYPHLSIEDPPDLFRMVVHDGWTETRNCLPDGDRFSHGFRLRNLFSLVLLKSTQQAE